MLEARGRCEKGSSRSEGSPLGMFGQESTLACIAILLNGLKGGSTRPFLRRVENVACCILLEWDGDDVEDAVGDMLREAAACVLCLVPHCGKEVECAWGEAIESWCTYGIFLLTAAWSPGGDNGNKSSSGTSQTTGKSISSFHHLLPQPSDLLDMSISDRLSAVCGRFHGICAVLSHMLKGSTFGRFVYVPTSCILDLIIKALTVVDPGIDGAKRGATERALLSSKFLHQVIRKIRSCALRVLVAMVSTPSAALICHSRPLMECIATCIEAETVENCRPDPQALLALGILSRQLGPGFTTVAADGALPALFRALNQCRVWKQQEEPDLSCNDQKSQKSRKRQRGFRGNIPRQTVKLDGQQHQSYSSSSSSLTKPATSSRKTSRTNVRKGKKVRENENFSSLLPGELHSDDDLDGGCGLEVNSSVKGGDLTPDYSTVGAAARWGDTDLSCFSAAGLHALANVVLSGGGYLLPRFRSHAEALAGDAIICLRNSCDGSVESYTRAAWVRGDQTAVAVVDLVIACVQAPLWDGTRSLLVGKAVEMFRWLLSRGENESIQSAAQYGLSACQALLNPRFAPLVKTVLVADTLHTSVPVITTSMAPPLLTDKCHNLAESKMTLASERRITTTAIYSENTVLKDKQDDIGIQACNINGEGSPSCVDEAKKGGKAMNIGCTEALEENESNSSRLFTEVIGKQGDDLGELVVEEDDVTVGHNTTDKDKNNVNEKEGSLVATLEVTTPKNEWLGDNNNRMVVTEDSCSQTDNGKCKNRLPEEDGPDGGGCLNHQYTQKNSRNDSLISGRISISEKEDINSISSTTMSSSSTTAILKSISNNHTMIISDSEDSYGSLPEIDIEDLTDDEDKGI